MHADPDFQLGDVVRRLSQLRHSLGDTVYAEAIYEVLCTIGGVAMQEAERRARSRRDRGAGRPLHGELIPFPTPYRTGPGAGPE